MLFQSRSTSSNNNIITELLCFILYSSFLAIVLSVLLRFTDSDYHFGIFKLFVIYQENLVFFL